MTEWTPIIVMLLATLGVVAIVRRLQRIEDKIDRLIALFWSQHPVEFRERANDRS